MLQTNPLVQPTLSKHYSLIYVESDMIDFRQ